MGSNPKYLNIICTNCIIQCVYISNINISFKKSGKLLIEKNNTKTNIFFFGLCRCLPVIVN